MSISSASTGRVSIKLKPRTPARPSLGSATAEVMGRSSNPFNTSSSSLSAAPTGAASAATAVLPHTPESVARSSPFWATTIQMLDTVLDPKRLEAVLAVEESQKAIAATNKNDTVSSTEISSVPALDAKYTYSCEEVCNAVRCVCDLGASEALYNELYSRLEAHITDQVKKLVETVDATASEAKQSEAQEQRALEDIVKLWSAVIRNVMEIGTVFMYLDRRYVLNETRDGSIFNLGVNLFKSAIMFRGRSITTKANAGFLRLLREDRASELRNHGPANGAGANESADPAAVARSLHLTRYRDMTLAVQLYFSELEPLIIQHSEEEYKELGNRLLMGDEEDDEETNDKSNDNDNASHTNKPTTSSSSGANQENGSSDDEDDMNNARKFFLSAERIIQSEHRRVSKYLDARTRPKLDEALQLRMVKPLVPTLFDNDFAKLVSQNRLTDISRGFKLMCLRHVNAKDTAKKTFTTFVKKWASKFVSLIGKEDDNTFVPNLLALDAACDTIIEVAFTPGYGEEFHAAKSSAFEAALQEKQQRVSQLLVIFMDNFLRSSSSGTARPATAPTVVILGEGVNGTISNVASPNIPAPLKLYAHSSPAASPVALTANNSQFPLSTSSAALTEAASTADLGHTDPTHQLDKALRIFVYLPSKDMFEAFYLREFANRILSRRSASTELERHVIAKLKGLCGTQLTKQLEGILRDLDTSSELTEAFRGLIRDRENGVDINASPAPETSTEGPTERDKDSKAAKDAPTEKEQRKPMPPAPLSTTTEGSLLLHTSVNTLTQSFWPFFDTFTPSQKFFPKQCSVLVEQFEAFYARQFRQRSLTWVHSLSQCTVRAIYGSHANQHKELHASFLQGLILSLCFPQQKQAQEMSFAQILRRVCEVDEDSGAPVATSVGVRTSPSGVILTKIQQTELGSLVASTKMSIEQYAVRQMVVCALLGLITPKVQLLQRVSNGDDADTLFAVDVKDSDMFRVNGEFTHKARSVRVPQILPKNNDWALGGRHGTSGPMGALGGATDEALQKKIESQRQYLLDATIAKIIKARHSCSHADLVGEVLKVVSNRFSADAAGVKLRIEELIKRSIIERDTKDHSLYHFKA